MFPYDPFNNVVVISSWKKSVLSNIRHVCAATETEKKNNLVSPRSKHNISALSSQYLYYNRIRCTYGYSHSLPAASLQSTTCIFHVHNKTVCNIHTGTAQHLVNSPSNA